MDYIKEFDIVLPEIERVLAKIETYASCIASLYDNDKYEEDFINEMQMKELDLIKLITKINDIAMRAMAANDKSILLGCENIKAKVVNVMETVRNLYM